MKQNLQKPIYDIKIDNEQRDIIHTALLMLKANTAHSADPKEVEILVDIFADLEPEEYGINSCID